MFSIHRRRRTKGGGDFSPGRSQPVRCEPDRSRRTWITLAGHPDRRADSARTLTTRSHSIFEEEDRLPLHHRSRWQRTGVSPRRRRFRAPPAPDGNGWWSRPRTGPDRPADRRPRSDVGRPGQGGTWGHPIRPARGQRDPRVVEIAATSRAPGPGGRRRWLFDGASDGDPPGGPCCAETNHLPVLDGSRSKGFSSSDEHHGAGPGRRLCPWRPHGPLRGRME